MATCTDCGASLGRSLWTFWNKNDYECDNKSCDGHLCSTCIDKHPLYVVLDKSQPNDIQHATLQKYCKSCFQDTSTLDFSRTYDTMEGTSDVTFVFLHGGAGCRMMFYEHARELKEKHGHSSVLLDLPGHGTLVDTPLSVESCATTLEKVLKECNITPSTQNKVVLVGGSMGAYVGFYLLEKLQDYFQAAILLDCGQNVGPGCSYKAKMGLVFLAWLGRNFSNASLMKMMVDVSTKSTADYKLLETCFQAGMFFDQAQQQVDCLRAVAPADYIPQYQIPVLFFNGSKDYRDSEDKWLELCSNSNSELKVYEGGDHFFIHDSRFVDDMLTRFHDFASKA